MEKGEGKEGEEEEGTIQQVFPNELDYNSASLKPSGPQGLITNTCAHLLHLQSILWNPTESL